MLKIAVIDQFAKRVDVPVICICKVVDKHHIANCILLLI